MDGATLRDAQLVDTNLVGCSWRRVDAAGAEGVDVLVAPARVHHAEAAEVEHSLFDERFLLARPILRALRSPNAVLLVDEAEHVRLPGADGVARSRVRDADAQPHVVRRWTCRRRNARP